MRRETNTMVAKEMRFYVENRFDHYKDSKKVMARKIDNFNFDLDGVGAFEIKAVAVTETAGLIEFDFYYYGHRMVVEVYKNSYIVTKNAYSDMFTPFVVADLVQKIRKLF